MTLVETTATVAVLFILCLGVSSFYNNVFQLSQKTAQIRYESQAIKFVTLSFRRLCRQLPDEKNAFLYRNMAIENWKEMVSSLYPDVKLTVKPDRNDENMRTVGMTLEWYIESDKSRRCVYEKLCTN